jgi:hypothetical protein
MILTGGRSWHERRVGRINWHRRGSCCGRRRRPMNCGPHKRWCCRWNWGCRWRKRHRRSVGRSGRRARCAHAIARWHGANGRRPGPSERYATEPTRRWNARHRFCGGVVVVPPLKEYVEDRLGKPVALSTIYRMLAATAGASWPRTRPTRKEMPRLARTGKKTPGEAGPNRSDVEQPPAAAADVPRRSPVRTS